jgi:hypothetical protein
VIGDRAVWSVVLEMALPGGVYLLWLAAGKCDRALAAFRRRAGS